jgi:hypothetical protein
MHRSHPAPMLRVHRGGAGGIVKRASASSVGLALLLSTISNNAALASTIRAQGPSAPKTATSSLLASSAGYQFDLRLDMASDGGQPSRTTFRGRASLAELDPNTSRIQIQSIEMAQTDNGGVIRIVELAEQFRSPLTESFDVNASATPTLSVGQTEPEEVTNIKRVLAKQIALTPNESQPLATQLATIRADVTDGFGTFKNRASLARSKGKLVLKENRTEDDYTRLAIPDALNPDVVVQNTNVYNQSTGMLESSQTFEAISVDYGTLPESAQNPSGAGARIVQTASSRMSVSKSGQGEPLTSPSESRRSVPIDTVVTDEMQSNARKASAPTFDEAMATISADPAAPSAALGLSARLQADPLAIVSLRKSLEAGSVSPELLPAVTAALIETNTTEAQLLLATSILGRGDLSAPQRQHLALTIGSIENPNPNLLVALRSAKRKELVSARIGSEPERPDPDACRIDPDDCIPVGGGGTGTGTPPLMTFPYSKNWNQRIGNGILGADIGATIAITRNSAATSDYNSDVNAYAKGLILNQQFSIVDANLKTLSDRDGNRRVEASIDVRGRGRETFTAGTGCSVDLEGNLYEGTLPFFATNFWIPVGPVVFYGGASAAGHVSVPWSVSARTCGSEGYAVGGFDPNVYVEVRAYGGISIFIASAGLEAIGTIAKLTMSPSARILWKPTVSPDAAANFRLRMAFQPFSLKVRAWLRVLFWTKRWTLAEWSTPTLTWIAAEAQTANWLLVYRPEIFFTAPQLAGGKVSDSNGAQSTKPTTTTTPLLLPSAQGTKPISAQSIVTPATVPSSTTAPVTSFPTVTTAAPTTTVPQTKPTVPQTIPTTVPPATETKPTTKPTTPPDTKPPTPTAPTTSITPTTSTTPPTADTKPTIPPATTLSPAGSKPTPVLKSLQRVTDSLVAIPETELKEERS